MSDELLDVVERQDRRIAELEQELDALRARLAAAEAQRDALVSAGGVMYTAIEAWGEMFDRFVAAMATSDHEAARALFPEFTERGKALDAAQERWSIAARARAARQEGAADEQ